MPAPRFDESKHKRGQPGNKGQFGPGGGGASQGGRPSKKPGGGTFASKQEQREFGKQRQAQMANSGGSPQAPQKKPKPSLPQPSSPEQATNNIKQMLQSGAEPQTFKELVAYMIQLPQQVRDSIKHQIGQIKSVLGQEWSKTKSEAKDEFREFVQGGTDKEVMDSKRFIEEQRSPRQHQQAAADFAKRNQGVVHAIRGREFDVKVDSPVIQEYLGINLGIRQNNDRTWSVPFDKMDDFAAFYESASGKKTYGRERQEMTHSEQNRERHEAMLVRAQRRTQEQEMLRLEAEEYDVVRLARKSLEKDLANMKRHERRLKYERLQEQKRAQNSSDMAMLLQTLRETVSRPIEINPVINVPEIKMPEIKMPQAAPVTVNVPKPDPVNVQVNVEKPDPVVVNLPEPRPAPNFDIVPVKDQDGNTIRYTRILK